MTETSAPATVLTSDESGVRTITLQRPDALNAFNRQLHGELLEALRGAEREAAVRAIVLTARSRSRAISV